MKMRNMQHGKHVNHVDWFETQVSRDCTAEKNHAVDSVSVIPRTLYEKSIRQGQRHVFQLDSCIEKTSYVEKTLLKTHQKIILRKTK